VLTDGLGFEQPDRRLGQRIVARRQLRPIPSVISGL